MNSPLNNQPKFREKIHPSWIIALFCLGILIGIGLSIFDKLKIIEGYPWIFIGISFCLLAIFSQTRWMLIFALIGGVLIGLIRGNFSQSDLSVWQNYIDREISITGTVDQDPGTGNGGMLNLNLSNIIIDGEKIPGNIFVSINAKNQEILRSDEVIITGKVKEGFGSFSAAISYAKLDEIISHPGADPAREIRDNFGDKLHEVIPGPAADLGMGILAGQKTALPYAISATFIASGLMHIVVASGYNLTILVNFSRKFFLKISRLVSFILSCLMVFMFASVTGFNPSMMRASLVATLSLVAWYYGRRFHPAVLLSITAAITVMIEPAYLWGDAGWWMSFSSFAGVLIFAPLVKNYFWDSEPEFRENNIIQESFTKNNDRKLIKKKHVFREIFIETLSAQLLSAPIIALMMGQIAPYGLLANLLVLPIIPITMLATFITGIASFILPHFIAEVIALPAKWLLNYIINTARIVSELPGAHYEISFGITELIVMICVILSITVLLKWKTNYDFYKN